MAISMTPAMMPIGSPSATETRAATAPSVETIGATMDTLPTRSAAYVSCSPTT